MIQPGGNLVFYDIIFDDMASEFFFMVEQVYFYGSLMGSLVIAFQLKVVEFDEQYFLWILSPAFCDVISGHFEGLISSH